jgi:hypothetical protein
VADQQQFQDWKHALTHAAKHSGDKLIFIQQVNECLEQLFPELKIETKITSDEWVADQQQFQDWKHAVTHAAKHSGDKLIFIQQVNECLEQLFPELEINTAITSDEWAYTSGLRGPSGQRWVRCHFRSHMSSLSFR